MGDLIETFLDLDAAKMEMVVKSVNEEAAAQSAEAITVEELNHITEELTRLH